MMATIERDTERLRAAQRLRKQMAEAQQTRRAGLLARILQFLTARVEP